MDPSFSALKINEFDELQRTVKCTQLIRTDEIKCLTFKETPVMLLNRKQIGQTMYDDVTLAPWKY